MVYPAVFAPITCIKKAHRTLSAGLDVMVMRVYQHMSIIPTFRRYGGDDDGC